MTKKEIIKELEKHNIEFNKSDSKAELEKLLNSRKMLNTEGIKSLSYGFIYMGKKFPTAKAAAIYKQKLENGEIGD
jgi:hypothetical protein